jgi:hypothetical protein
MTDTPRRRMPGLVNVRLTHIDGKLPNLALMKLSHFHRSAGDSVTFSKSLSREMFEPAYDRVYGSAIFGFSKHRLTTFLEQFPNAVVGGTGTDSLQTVEQFLGVSRWEWYDYSIYPDFTGSIGFTARGCRLRCGFCVVPNKEGRPAPMNSIAQIWRGEPYPKHLHLLDNDFFGQPKEQWLDRVREILEGKFKVCFNQGINIRLITEEAAEWIAKLPYYDDQFKTRRLYTAWDNLKDEKIFFRGVENLKAAGVPPTHLMVYMLVGYDKEETLERIMYRFKRMTEIGIRPYPMVYNNQNPQLKRFQRWVIRKYYQFVPFEEYDVNAKGHSFDTEQLGLEDVA